MNVIITGQVFHSKGVLIRFNKEGQSVQVLFLTHAIGRMAKWNLTFEMVGETLLEPEEVLKGHHDRFIAHKRYGQHILRVVYEYDDLIPTVVTVYFPYKERYFEGGGQFEDQILK